MWGLVSRLAALLAVLLVAPIAGASGMPLSAAASAAPAAYTYDASAYVYDAPALLSSPDTAASYVRGSPSGPEVASWGRSVSAGDRGVAANTAEGAADAALAAGKTRGAASALQLADGSPPIVDVSGSARVINPEMQAALDSIPQDLRPGFHGWCSEIGCMNQALNEGRSLAGGTMRTVAIGDSPPGHSLPKAPCPTCEGVMRLFGVSAE